MTLPYLLDPAFPTADGDVYRMIIYKGVLYISGAFSNVGGQPRQGFAAIDPITDALLPFTLASGIAPGEIIKDFVIVNDVIYATGSFVTPKNRAAAWDILGNPLPWNPNLNSQGLCIVADGSNIVIGGSFTTVNGATTRNHIASFNLSTGSVSAWNPNVDNDVNSILILGSIAYVGGSFNTVNGATTRNFAASFDTTSALVTAWDPNPNSNVNSIEYYNNTIYLAGNFFTVNGGAFVRPGLAAFNPTTGAVVVSFTLVNGSTGTRVRQFNGKLYFSGTVNGNAWVGFSFLDPSSGAVIEPAINLSGRPYDFTVLGARSYFGGLFTDFVGNIARKNIAAYVFGTNTLKSLNIDMDNVIKKALLSPAGDIVYIFGAFTTVTGSNGTFSRVGAAAIDVNTNEILPWNPIIVFGFFGILDATLFGSSMYMVGDITTINGTPRNFAGAVDVSTGATLPWDPNISSVFAAESLLVFGGSVYVGGSFTAVNGGAFVRNNIARFDLTLGVCDALWDPNVITGAGDLGVKTIKTLGSNIYIGGGFITVGGQPRRCLARVSNAGVGAVDLTWIFDIASTAGNPSIEEIQSDSSSNVFVVGRITTVNGVSQEKIAKITSGGALDPTWSNSIGLDPLDGLDGESELFVFGTLLISYEGRFLQNGSLYRPRVASVTTLAGVIGSFAPSPYGSQRCVSSFVFNSNSNILVIAGNFAFVGMQEAEHLAAITIPGPEPLGLPQAPKIRFLNRRPQQGAPALTMFRWDVVVRDEQNNQTTSTMYRVYRSISKNLEDPTLISEITTTDLKGDVDTLFVEEIDGYYKYCVSAVNSVGEGGKSCVNFAETQQLERLG
jgi:hypothetical protein